MFKKKLKVKAFKTQQLKQTFKEYKENEILLMLF